MSKLTPELQETFELLVQIGLPVIVTGRRGPTGKTTLKDKLVEAGIKAIEAYELDEPGNKQLKAEWDALDMALTVRLDEILPMYKDYMSPNNE